MRRIARVAVILTLVAGLPGIVGCREKVVTVATGTVEICTEGEIVSDTTEEIEVPASEVDRYGVKTSVVTCELHEKLAALYERAQAAIRAGDLDAAEKNLAQIVAQAPTYRRATSQLDEIKTGKTPSPDGGSAPSDTTTGTAGDGAGGETPGGEAPTGPILNLIGYVPDTILGYIGQGLTADPFVLTREYIPGSGGGPISRLVVVVEQFKDKAAAESEMNAAIKFAYPTSGSSVTIDGRAGYFGARGSVAIVAFVDGALLVAVEGAVTSGESASLRNELARIAQAIAP